MSWLWAGFLTEAEVWARAEPRIAGYAGEAVSGYGPAERVSRVLCLDADHVRVPVPEGVLLPEWVPGRLERDGAVGEVVLELLDCVGDIAIYAVGVEE